MTSIASRMGVAVALGFSALGCGERSIYIGVCIGWRAPATYSAGDSADSLDLADLNGDGAPDIVRAGLYSIGMLLNRGDGTFADAVLLASSENLPIDTEVADLDGDGDRDIVFTEWVTIGTASVLWNDGDATFTAGPDLVVHPATNGFADNVRALDWNGDGKVDLVFSVADVDVDAICVLLNQGDGTFAAPLIHDLSDTRAWSLVAAELSGDGKPDVAFVDYETNELHVMLQQADGTLAEAGTYATGMAPIDVAAADLNGDGEPDLLVASSDDLDGIQLFLGEGGGTFAPALSFATRAGVSSIAVVDMDRDGMLDLALARYAKRRDLALLRGLGDGIFSRPDYTDLAGSERAIAASDLNGDGAPDLVLAGGYGDLTVLLNCPE